MDNIQGNWVGRITGTNNGNVFVEIFQKSNSLSGSARIADLMFGTIVYHFSGQLDGKSVNLNMVPDPDSMAKAQSATMLVNQRPVTIQVPAIQYGQISVVGELQDDGKISGTWKSTLGTGGTVYLWQENGKENIEPKSKVTVKKNKAFVMMSISPEDHRLEDVLSSIKRATRQYGVDCIRVDEIQHSGKITDLILEHIATSEYLICDISTERPNVYYELGYAHGIKKEVILIAEADSNIHFDIKDYNVIFYKSFTELETQLSKRLEARKQ
jgi:hypothetical protein